MSGVYSGGLAVIPVVVAATLGLGGCVSSRELLLTIADRDSGAPVEAAQVTIWQQPVFAKLGAQSVPQEQQGLTDANGQWSGRVANGAGSLKIERRGYGETLVFFDSGWRWPGSMQLLMTRSACGETPASGGD